MARSRLHRQFVRHKPSGQIWAVELQNGAVCAAVGPLGRTEVNPLLLQYLYFEVRDVAWIRRHADEFAVL